MSKTKTRWSKLGAAWKNSQGGGYSVRLEGLADAVIGGVAMKSMPMRFQIFAETSKKGDTYLVLTYPHPETGDRVETKIEPEIVAEPNGDATTTEEKAIATF